MVVTLGPGKFYGSSLPRPRFFDNITFNSERVDPPLSVMDPLLSWAREAHWSMGGLSTDRLRLQGRIEGNVDRLRKSREKQTRATPLKRKNWVTKGDEQRDDGSVSPPPVPRVTKKRKFIDLFEGEEERKCPARKLVDEFEKVEELESESVRRRARSNNRIGDPVMKNKLKKRLRKVGEDEIRSSPRFAKENSAEI